MIRVINIKFVISSNLNMGNMLCINMFKCIMDTFYSVIIIIILHKLCILKYRKYGLLYIYIYDLLIHPIYTVFVINNIKSKILCW